MFTQHANQLVPVLLACLGPAAAHADTWDGLAGGIQAGVVRSHAHYQTGPNDESWFHTTAQTASMWLAGNRGDADYTALAGLSLVYGKQSGTFVYGAQLGVNAMHSPLDSSNRCKYTIGTQSYTFRQSATATGLYTLAARAGHAFAHSLLSGTAGLAVTRLSTVLDFGDTYAGAGQYHAYHNDKRAKAGWTVGLDYQYRLAGGLGLKGEYTYIDFGRTSMAAPTSAADGTYITAMNLSAKVRMSTFLFGIEKQF